MTSVGRLTERKSPWALRSVALLLLWLSVVHEAHRPARKNRGRSGQVDVLAIPHATGPTLCCTTERKEKSTHDAPTCGSVVIHYTESLWCREIATKVKHCEGTPEAIHGRLGGLYGMVYAAKEASFTNKRLGWAFFGYCLCGFPPPLAVNGQAFKIFQPLAWSRLDSQACPESCRDVFEKLEDGPTFGSGMVQHVEVRQRGEPKSGTGFMFEWAVGALAHSCMYLQSAYGGESCRIETRATNRTLVFDPHLAANNPGPCVCDDIDRVTISLFNFDKHKLPVEDDCNWSRVGGISKTHHTACSTRPDAKHLQNKDELWKCVEKSRCRITDESLQMAVMRDPRAVVVSAYFHHLHEHPFVVHGLSVDEFALALLPVVCQWVSIRYFVFSEILSPTSKIFWYDDAKLHPREWHRQLLSFVGLRVPDYVVSKAADAAENGGRILGFPAKGIDEHQGGAEATTDRFFTNEVRVATLVQMDSVLRLWLPDAVLEHLDMAA